MFSDPTDTWTGIAPSPRQCRRQYHLRCCHTTRFCLASPSSTVASISRQPSILVQLGWGLLGRVVSLTKPSKHCINRRTARFAVATWLRPDATLALSLFSHFPSPNSLVLAHTYTTGLSESLLDTPKRLNQPKTLRAPVTSSHLSTRHDLISRREPARLAPPGCLQRLHRLLQIPTASTRSPRPAARRPPARRAGRPSCAARRPSPTPSRRSAGAASPSST